MTFWGLCFSVSVFSKQVSSAEDPGSHLGRPGLEAFCPAEQKESPCLCSSASLFLRTERLLPLQFHLRRGHPDLWEHLRSHNVLSTAQLRPLMITCAAKQEVSLQRSPSPHRAVSDPTTRVSGLTLTLGVRSAARFSVSSRSWSQQHWCCFTDNKTFPRTPPERLGRVGKRDGKVLSRPAEGGQGPSADENRKQRPVHGTGFKPATTDCSSTGTFIIKNKNKNHVSSAGETI